MESVESLVREVLTAALRMYSHHRAVRETMTWLVGHATEFDIFAMPLVRRQTDSKATSIELAESGALIQGRLRDRVEFRRGRG